MSFTSGGHGATKHGGGGAMAAAVPSAAAAADSGTASRNATQGSGVAVAMGDRPAQSGTLMPFRKTCMVVWSWPGSSSVLSMRNASLIGLVAAGAINSVRSGLRSAMSTCWFRNVKPAGALDAAITPCTICTMPAVGTVTLVASGSAGVTTMPVLTVPPALTARSTTSIATLMVTVTVLPTALR